MAKNWNAERLGTDINGMVCYEISCKPEEEELLLKILNVYNKLKAESPPIYSWDECS